MKLTDQQWIEVKTRFQLGESINSIAMDYGVPESTVRAGKTKEGWTHNIAGHLAIDFNINETLKDCFNADMEKLKLIKEIYTLKKDCEKVYASAKIVTKRGVREKAALDTIEQLLGIKLIRQFEVGGFKIDGYDIENKVAYEIDEEQHNSKKHSQHDVLRQKFIEEQLNCTFKRIKV